MCMHNHHLEFLKAAENIAQLYRDDRKKNIFCTCGYQNKYFIEKFVSLSLFCQTCSTQSSVIALICGRLL